ncbi:glycosyltransferase [Cobetia sp. MC34]|nr:glycosyltransferase [Cobetia sp. MC34]
MNRPVQPVPVYRRSSCKDHHATLTVLAQGPLRGLELFTNAKSFIANPFIGINRRSLHTLRVRILHWDQPFNCSAINNFGAREALGDIIGLVNNDIELMNGEWLTEMVSQVCRPNIGCVGAKRRMQALSATPY